MNTNTLGNMTESVILTEFQKNEIPVLIPFGRNEPYDFVVDTKKGFKSIQVKHGILKNGCIVADIRHRRTTKKKIYDTYYKIVDYIAVWCSQINKIYLLPLEEIKDKTNVWLRIEEPKNNSCISTIIWAKDFEFDKRIAELE